MVDDDKEKKQASTMPPDEKNHLMDPLLKTYKGYDETEVEVT